MRTIQRTRLWILLTALLALAPLGSALAAKPVITTFEVPVVDDVLVHIQGTFSSMTSGTGLDAE